MKHFSTLLALLIVVTTAIAATNKYGVLAYFQFDEKLTGTPIKTVLPDGRVHVKFQEKKNEPFPEGVEFPKHLKLDHYNEDEIEPTEAFYSVHGEAIFKAHWTTFDLDEHTEASKLVCHDRGDKNMRMSVFGASAKFIDYLKNKKESIVLTANGNKHVCHGDPIFRIVTDVHFFDNEVLLITAKASYEDIFDHANIGFEIKHPKLTHVRDDVHVIDKDGDDHGVTNNKNELHAPAFEVPSTTFGSEAVPAVHNRMNAEEDVAKMNSQEVEAASSSSTSSSSRSAQKKGWFKKLKKKVKKFVKKTVKRVKSAVSKVVKAVSKGIKSVKSLVQKWTTYEKRYTKPLYSFSKNYVRSVKIVRFTASIKFYSTFKFHLYIKSARLEILHTSVYGQLDFAGAASIPEVRYSSSGQSLLWDVPQTKYEFKILGFKLYIQYNTRCLAAYTLNAGGAVKLGFQVKNTYARFGVEYTRSRGFQKIVDKNFRRSQSLDYSASFDATPTLQAQFQASLYTLAKGFVQLNSGLDAYATTTNKACNLIKAYAAFNIQVSAGLNIELKIFGKKIYSKNYGPDTVLNYRYTALNVCKNRRTRRAEEVALALPSPVEEKHLSALENAKSLPEYHPDGQPVLRNAMELSSDVSPITQLDEDDSGKTWTHDFKCSSAPNTAYNIGLTGFFENGTTVFYVTLTRNMTYTPDNNESTLDYSLMTQSALASMESSVVAGQAQTYKVLRATQENAEGLGLDYDDIVTLTQSSNDTKTTPLNLTTIQLTFDASNMDKVTVNSAEICPSEPAQSANTYPNNSTEPAPAADGSYFGRMFANFAASLFPAFIRLITDVLIIVLILAAAEFIVAYLAPRILGEHWPKTATNPRTREWVYMTTGVCVGILSMIIFIVGANLTFAEITGAQLADNFTAPVQEGEDSYLTASGVQTIVWKFTGASIELNKCPQYYPCSPDCRDLCKKQTRSWTNAPWPFCSEDSVVTDHGTCTKFAWDNILNAIFFVCFLFIGTVVAMKKCDTIYRRLICLHACLMLAGMFLNLMWRRMDSFMKEVDVQQFDPADEMIVPFDLAMNPSSTSAWEAAITIYWIMVGLVSVGMGYDMYLYRKDTMEGKITRFDDGFEANYQEAGSASSNGKEPAARPRSNTEIDINADLAGLPTATNSEMALNKGVNQNELALM